MALQEVPKFWNLNHETPSREVSFSIPLNPNQLGLLDRRQFSIHDGRPLADLTRSLFGIIGMNDGDDGWVFAGGRYVRRINYQYFYIPECNKEALVTAFDTGVFTKDVKAEDLMVLDAIYSRSMDLARIRGSYGNPRFHINEVLRLTDLSENRARQSLDSLVGILAQTAVTGLRELPGADSYETTESRTVTSPRWFLPNARLRDAKNLLDRELY